MESGLLPESIELHCVWPDYQPIRADMDIDPLISSTLERYRPVLNHFGIGRITLINDVIYPFTYIARDVLKLDSEDVKKLGEEEKSELYETMVTIAEQLTLDPCTPSQAVLWNNDIYILMSTRAATLKNKQRTG